MHKRVPLLLYRHDMSEAYVLTVQCRHQTHSGIARSVHNSSGPNGLSYRNNVRGVGIDLVVVAVIKSCSYLSLFDFAVVVVVILAELLLLFSGIQS